MTEQIAEAQYEDQWNPPEGVAPYLRFGGRISEARADAVRLEGAALRPMGQPLAEG
jgi:hypothetical protein